MGKTKLVRYGAAAVAVLGMIGSIGYLRATRGVCLSVTNNTRSTLRHVDIAYTGGVVHIAAIEPKASHGQRVNPAGESALTLSWVDPSGAKHSRDIDTYLEPGYTGNVKIALESDNRVSVTQKVRVGLILRGPATRTYSLQSDTNSVRR